MKIHVSGLKCDNPKCNYADSSITKEEYKEYINAKCPECGSVLLTQADYNTVQRISKLVKVVDIIETAFEKLGLYKKDDENFLGSVELNGTGKLKFKKC